MCNNLSKIYDYYKFCDALHKEWFNNNLAKDAILEDLFQMDYSPEPYFVLKNGDNPLYMLLTNPGDGMDFQHRKNFEKSDYSNFSKKLVDKYTSEEFKTGAPNAHRRLQKSIVLSQELGYNALVNIETVPFHSPDIKKPQALKAIHSSYPLFAYHNVLKNFLIGKPVLIVTATGTKHSISISNLTKSPWIMYQMDLAGMNVDGLKMEILTEKNGKITSAIFSDNDKHIVLMMGSNNLPS